MSEAALQLLVIEAAEALGWYVYHVGNVKGQLRNSTSVGFPDLVMVRDRVLFVELKSATGKLSREQEEWRRQILRTGEEHHVWRPKHWENNDILTELQR